MAQTDRMTAEEVGEVDARDRASRFDRWDARTGPWLDRLALVFPVTVIVQWLYIYPPGWLHDALLGIQMLIWAAFAVDYVTRVRLVDDKRDMSDITRPTCSWYSSRCCGCCASCSCCASRCAPSRPSESPAPC